MISHAAYASTSLSSGRIYSRRFADLPLGAFLLRVVNSSGESSKNEGDIGQCCRVPLPATRPRTGWSSQGQVPLAARRLPRYARVPGPSVFRMLGADAFGDLVMFAPMGAPALQTGGTACLLRMNVTAAPSVVELSCQAHCCSRGARASRAAADQGRDVSDGAGRGGAS